MKPSVKNIFIYAGIAAFFLILSYAFVPDVLSGKIVNQSDISGWKGMAQETLEWNKEHPDAPARWSGSMFGGMPNVTSIDDFHGDITKPLYKALLAGTRPASYIFIALLGAFLMMLAMGVNRFVAVAGAVAVAFCSYNFQIIQVGHNTKMQAIAFAPWVIAAVVFCYRAALGEIKSRRWLPLTALGAVLFALALSLQIKANHVQITYYLALLMIIYVIALFIRVLRDKVLLKRFGAASAMLLLGAAIGIGTNANKLIPTADYAPYTMRGGSELVREQASLGGSPETADGLDIEYATAWSYSLGEMPNLLIPNYNGGSSNGALSSKSATWDLFKRAGENPAKICRNLPLYWGPQPFTAGPMYLGAICIFLFILGLFLLEGRDKWWLVIASVLAILLSLGSNFLPFTKLWFEYAPMYNKFRTVSMALVTLQFTVPLLGIYALDRIVKEEIPHRQVVRGVWWALGITGGFCFLAALFPSIAGSFAAPSDEGMQAVITDALREDRRHLLQVDAWRSFLFVLASAGVIMWSYLRPDPFVAAGRIRIAAAVIGVLILADMWSAGKRYLSHDDFVTPRDFSAKFDKRAVDDWILEDKSPSYRVLDLSESTFNSSLTSYRHKSIGGYSPTKMQRYQDLIDRHLSREINDFYKAASSCKTLGQMQEAVPAMPVTSVLNGKYIIIGADYPPLENPGALGAAFLVNEILPVGGPNAEIGALSRVDLSRCAVVDTSAFEPLPAGPAAASDFIEMTSYTPDEVHYRYSASAPVAAVFSEVYHPSWRAYASCGGDFRRLELFRADWILRGAVLPEGEGEVIMRYVPEDYVVGENISRACSIALLVILAGIVAILVITGRKKE